MTDLASSIIGGANSAGNFVIETPQRVLYDARTSFQNFGDFTGDSANQPLVAPFKEGWIAYQAIRPYSGSPGTAGSYVAKFIRYNDLGEMVWETAKNTTIGALFNTGSERFMAGNSTHILVRKTGSGNHDFYLLDMSADNGTYTMPGSPAFSLSTSTFEQIDSHTGTYSAHDCGTGWIIFGIDLNGASSTVSVAGLDANFTHLGTATAGTWNTTEQRPWFTPDWNGTGPAIVQANSTTGAIKIWAVTFDGTAAPVIAASTTATIDRVTTNSGAQHGVLGNGMFDYRWVASNDPMNWNPSDGTSSISIANPYDWVFDDYEDHVCRGGSISVVSPSVIDFTNSVASSSPYYGDRYASQPPITRHNWVNWTTKTAGYVDIHLALPADATPGVTFSYGLGFDDMDQDESCFAILNPTNGKCFYWTILYWRENPHTVGCGASCGDNALISYWIAQLGEGGAPPTPEAPSWVNFFNTAGVPDPDCPMLGSGENRAFLYDRGGARKIGEITDTTLIRWSRQRDDISTATVIVNTPSPECAHLLRSIAVGRHEVVIFRDGQRMWEGPITRVGYSGGSVEIACEDVWFYTARTIMHHAYDNRYNKTKSKVGPVTHRAQIILATELARKERLTPSFNLLRFLDVRTHPNTTRTSRYTPAYASTVWEEIDYMAAKLSLDYTAVGRRMLLTDVHDVIGRTELLTDKDFNNPLIITTYGRELATVSAVTDGDGHWASVGGIDPFYGEYELLNTTYGEEVQPAGTTPTAEELKALQAEMASQAQRNLAGRYPVPTVVRVPDNTRLNPSAPVTIDDLIPGMRIPIRATQTVLVLEQEQKLDSVTVEQSSTDEIVTIVLSPAPGTTPWDDSSQTGGDDEVTT